MSYENEYTDDENTQEVASTQEKRLSFIQTHKLSPLQKRLKKISNKAIEVLEAILEDENSSTKEKMDASDKLLKMYIDVTKELNNDGLKRTLLQIKVDGGMMSGSKALPSGGEDDDEGGAVFMPDMVYDSSLGEGGRTSIVQDDDGGVIDLSKNNLENI